MFVRLFASLTLIAVVALSAPGLAHAECSVSTSGTGTKIPTCTGKVKQIYLHRDFFFIDMDGDETALASECTAYANSYLTVPADQPRQSQYLSLFVAAQMSGRSIKVRVAKNDKGECGVLYVMLDGP